MPRDTDKARARWKRHREKRKVAKYGSNAAGVDMRGRHGNHARGDRNAKWTGGRFVTSHGYVAVRVSPDHPHAWGQHPTVKYAYEHILIAEKMLGRSLHDDELVHHTNGVKTDNAETNLEVQTRSAHGIHHASKRRRDELGRFPPADLHVPEVTQ